MSMQPSNFRKNGFGSSHFNSSFGMNQSNFGKSNSLGRNETRDGIPLSQKTNFVAESQFQSRGKLHCPEPTFPPEPINIPIEWIQPNPNSEKK